MIDYLEYLIYKIEGLIRKRKIKKVILAYRKGLRWGKKKDPIG